MSKLFSASQYDAAYKPHKLGNWQVPDETKASVLARARLSAGAP